MSKKRFFKLVEKLINKGVPYEYCGFISECKICPLKKKCIDIYEINHEPMLINVLNDFLLKEYYSYKSKLIIKKFKC